jgi:Tol biopolymer transport system component
MVYDLKSGASSAAASVNGSLLSASWASNERIVCPSDLGGRDQLLWVNPGTNQSGVLLGGGANFVAPSVGPNGSLTYFSDLLPETGSEPPPEGGMYNVWTSEADGSDATYQFSIVLEHQGSIETKMVPYVPGVMVMTSPPSWSPAGSKIAYAASGTIFTQLFIWDVNTWTTSCVGPIQAGMHSQQPTWSADGVNVAFSCNLSGTYHIWVVPAAGGTGGQVASGY